MVDADKVQIAVGVTANTTGRVKAGELVNFVAAQVGGKGGGKPDLAMAGGTEPGKLAAALASVAGWVRPRPVSYTHLDVYKRQALRLPHAPGRPALRCPRRHHPWQPAAACWAQPRRKADPLQTGQTCAGTFRAAALNLPLRAASGSLGRVQLSKPG